ncbi:MAG: polysaccharide deacetylase family protein [Candidatus Atribacteria bacterium]|nr:polysaccharide deacetylase family protein [Candidatus Atribacteria bacterium]
MYPKKPSKKNSSHSLSSLIASFFVVAILLFSGYGDAIEIKETVFGLNQVRYLGGNQEAKNKIALTFDDAPNGATGEILRILKEEKVRATFFLIGSQVKKYPDVARAIVQEGHEIGNHSHSHRIDESFTLEEILQDLRQAEEIIKDVTGCIPSYFRPPRGFTNGKIKEACGMMGYSIVMWWVDSRDWQLEGQEILDGVCAHVRSGGIVLLHSLPQTAQILSQMIQALEKKGYMLVTISDLLEG